MKLQLLAALATGLALVAAAPADKGEKADKEKLQGTWTLSSVEINKKPLAMDQLKNARLVVKGQAYSFALGDIRLEIAFKMDPGKKPKAIDLTVTEGPQKGKTYRGIYKLEDDTYTVCRSVEPEKDRPDEFATRPDSGLMLIVWKRAKP